MAKDKRKRFLINPTFQYAFLKIALLAALAIITSLFAANWYFFWRFRSLGESLRLPANHPYFQFLQSQMTTMGLVFLVTALVVVAVIVVGGLILSNRIAGPIFRICTDAKEMQRTGNLREISSRKTDFFPQLAPAINIIVRMKK